MTLFEFRDVLLTVGIPVYHLEADEEPDSFIVWSENGQGQTVWAGNRVALQLISGSLFYATKTEYDTTNEIIQDKLNEAGVQWRLVEIEYDKDTGYNIYEWAWTIC